MGQDSKGFIIKTKRMERVDFIGPTVTLIQGSSNIIEGKEKVL